MGEQDGRAVAEGADLEGGAPALEALNVRLPLEAGLTGEEGRKHLLRATAAALGVRPESVGGVRLLRRSVDARKKSDVHFVATLSVELDSAATPKPAPGVQLRPHAEKPSFLPKPVSAARNLPRPVVAGSGPAGLFCAWYLAKAGLRPLLVERGRSVEGRMRAVEAFAVGGPLDTQSNIQFGEGGAGTFSDGKLTTGIKSPYAADVLRLFVEAGAPEDILWQAKPHIGTDLLVDVVRNIRRQIQEAGGEVRFQTQLAGLAVEDGRVRGAYLEPTGDGSDAGGAGEFVETDTVVLACGHSARDTFQMLYDAGAAMEQKPFSVGVRIEHPQAMVDRAQYGAFAGHPALGAADYKLAVQLPATGPCGPRGVYTFCMCPGGEVVCAASEPETVVVNGMSRRARDGRNANSALLVGVGPGDFGSDHPLAGVEFQRRIERDAFRCAVEAGGAPYSAPAQTVGSFLGMEGKAAGQGVAAGAAVAPTYPRGVAWCDLRGCLPGFVADALAAALPLLDRRLRGFADPGAVLTGVETRSSSPVRILRGCDLQAYLGPASAERDAPGASGLYPCGEGAGYAGGIMSAACDGLRVAEAIARDAVARSWVSAGLTVF